MWSVLVLSHLESTFVCVFGLYFFCRVVASRWPYNRYQFEVCCCKRVARVKQLSMLPLFFAMIQTADDPNAFSNLERIELKATYFGSAGAVVLAEALTKCQYKLKKLTYVGMAKQAIGALGVQRMLDVRSNNSYEL